MTIAYPKKSRKSDTKSLRKKAWKLMSEYVRRRDEQNGCITCRKQIPWKEAHCGHYIHANHLDYNLKNCNLQCAGCNTYGHGRLDDYTFAIDDKWGAGTAKELHDQKHNLHKFTTGELEAIISSLNVLLDSLIITQHQGA